MGQNYGDKKNESKFLLATKFFTKSVKIFFRRILHTCLVLHDKMYACHSISRTLTKK